MTAYTLDPLRDARHRDARAARECADWLAWLELEGKAARTLDDYERTVAKLLRSFPHIALRDFSDGEILHMLREFPTASRRVRRAHLSSFFQWAVLTGRIDRNPMDRVPKVKTRPQRIMDTFSEAECHVLCNQPRPDGVLFAILLDSGIRKGEARRLQRKHINLEAGELVVYGGKGGKDRIVPFVPESDLLRLVSDLDLFERLERDDFLWYSRPGGGRISRSKPIGEASFHRWYVRCLDECGVRYRNPHVTRHTFATAWRQEGLDVDEIQILLGHASIKTTSDLYVHTNVNDVARRMAALRS